MESFGKRSVLIWALIFAGAYLNAVAMQYLWSISGDVGSYMGMQIYSFMPESLVWFGLCAFLLYRYIKNENWKQVGKTVLSAFFGFFIGFYAIYVQELSYNTTLFDSPVRTIRALLCTIGLMIFTVPMMSEFIGLCDSLGQKLAVGAGRDTGKKHLKPVVYGLLIWAVTFIYSASGHSEMASL